MFDILIKNGHVIDGTANPWFKADVGIKEDRFTEISSAALEDGDRRARLKKGKTPILMVSFAVTQFTLLLLRF